MILAGTMRLFVGDKASVRDLALIKEREGQLASIEQKILSALIEDVNSTELLVDSTELSEDAYNKLRGQGYVAERLSDGKTWISRVRSKPPASLTFNVLLQ